MRMKRKAEKKMLKEKNKIRKLEKGILKNKEAHDTGQEDEDSSSGRDFTISIALPGSIMDNAQSPELRTYLAGQIARALVIFQADEVVIFDESAASTSDSTEGEFSGVRKKGNCNLVLGRILQFLECPQYLRKAFFPKHKDLIYAGLLNPLDSPHHMREEDNVPYREGVTLDRPTKPGKGSYVNCGASKTVQIDKVIQPNIRVTVKIQPDTESDKYIQGTVVPPHYPRTKAGLYWGYNVRLAGSLSTAISECPFVDTGKYDLTIGTSEKGTSIDTYEMPKFKHLLVVFGGVQGLEAALDCDENLAGVDNPKFLFDNYLNTCEQQGSRTIRTEEALLVTLSALRPKDRKSVV